MHIAVVAPPYIAMMLEGRKRVESRFTRTRREPWGRVRPGDTVYFKRPGGPLVCRVSVVRVHQYRDLTPARVDELERRWNRLVCAPGSYWRQRRRARYLTLVVLSKPRPVRDGPRTPPLFGRGWMTLTPSPQAPAGNVVAR